MPPNIFNNCPTIEVFGSKMTHPHLMLIDAYRVYTDPMTSYFRLKKTFTRFNTLMKYYPLDDKMLYNKIENSEGINKHKKEENLLELYSKLEYDKTRIKNIMGKKQHYFVITGVIFMIIILFSIIYIMITVLIKHSNNI